MSNAVVSNDESVTKKLVTTLHDGEEGFAKAAEKLQSDGSPDIAQTFRTLSQQRKAFAGELKGMAGAYGDEVKESGSIAAAVHRGWMTVKDALSGSDVQGVLDAAEQGEDHAVKAYDEALEEEISSNLRLVVERQRVDVKAGHDTVRDLRDAHQS